jgi:5'-nucleotidase
MTHIGYDKDIELAKKTRGVHLIVGGHSHTLLGSMEGAEGPYPTIEKNLDGEEVFVVTSFRWGEYLGYIDVAFDPAGKIVAYTGGPIHLTNQTEQDAGLQKQIKEWRGPFEAFAAQVVGKSDVTLGA